MARYRYKSSLSEEEKRNLKVDLRRVSEWEAELESIRIHFKRFDLGEVKAAGWLINHMCKELHLFDRYIAERRDNDIKRWKYSSIDDLCSYAQSVYIEGIGDRIIKNINLTLKRKEDMLAEYKKKGITNSFWISRFTSKIDKDTLQRTEQEIARYRKYSEQIPQVIAAAKLLEEVIAETCGYTSRIYQLKERLSVAAEKKAAIERFEEKHGKMLAKAAAVDKKARSRATSLKRLVKKTKECPYCGKEIGSDPQLDHIYPISKGGLSIVENIVWCCSTCNSLKMDKGLVQFLKERGVSVDKALSTLHSLGKHV